MDRLDAAFSALADPTRRGLLRRIGYRPQRVADLCSGFSMSQPAISKHLRVLKEAGLVEVEERGRENIYRLSATGIAEVQACLEEIGAMWEQTLKAFARYVEGDK